MKKNIFKIIYITFISIICFCVFSSRVKAVVTCEVNRKSDYEASFHIYDTSDTEHDGSYVTLRLNSTYNTISYLNVCGEQISNLSTAKSFSCPIDGGVTHTVSFGSVNLAKKFYKLTDTLKCGVTYPSTVNITGLVNAPDDVTSESIMCSGAGYNFIVRKGQDNQTECKVTIQQDTKDSNVIMKHGSLTTINPSAGKYTCKTPEGDEVEFSLSKSLSKGSLKSTSDCPKLTAVSGTDGTQEEIENPVVEPDDEPDSTPDDYETPTLPTPTDKSKKTKISIQNIFNVSTGKITCTGALSNTMPILRDIFKYIRIAAVVLFIILTSLDYVKAIASSDQSVFKKSNSRLVKRLIGVLAIIMLPSLINLILAIVQLSNGACGIK